MQNAQNVVIKRVSTESSSAGVYLLCSQAAPELLSTSFVAPAVEQAWAETHFPWSGGFPFLFQGQMHVCHSVWRGSLSGLATRCCSISARSEVLFLAEQLPTRNLIFRICNPPQAKVNHRSAPMPGGEEYI